MIYFKSLKENVFDPAVSSKYFEVLAIGIDGQVFSTQQILANPQLLLQFNNSGIPTKVCWSEDHEKPTLLISAAIISSIQNTDLSAAYNASENYANKTTGEITEQAKTALMGPFTQVYGNNADLCYQIVASYLHYYFTEVEISTDVDPMFMLNEETIQKYQSEQTKMNNANQALPLDVMNNTLYQNVCTDKLFIEIPFFNQVQMASESDAHRFIPHRSKVCTPYSDVRAEHKNYKEFQELQPLIGVIEGSPDNNNLPIQENEREYYEALTQWVQHNLVQVNPGVNFDFENDVIPLDVDSQNYFESLATTIYTWHWSHLQGMPVGIDWSADEDEDDSVPITSSEIASKYLFDVSCLNTSIGGMMPTNVLVSLQMFLENASTKIGYRAYLEAVIKLARWGSRKPTELILEGYDRAFVLATGKTKSVVSNIKDCTLERIDGKDSRLIGFIVTNATISDNTIDITSVDTPLGIVTESVYLPKAGSPIRVVQYYSMFDAIPMLKSGDLSVAGIDVADGRLSISVDEDSLSNFELQGRITGYENTMDSYLQNPFYRSPELTNLFTQFKAKLSEGNKNLMSIFFRAIQYGDIGARLESCKMSKFEDVAKIITGGVLFSPEAVLVANLTRMMLGPVSAAQELCDNESTAVEIFEAWEKALVNWHGIEEGFYVQAEQETASQQPTPQTGMAQSNSFGTAQTTNQTATQMAQSVTNEFEDDLEDKDDIPNLAADLVQPVSTGPFKRILGLNGEVLGCYTIGGTVTTAEGTDKIYVLCDNTKLNEMQSFTKEELTSPGFVKPTGKGYVIPGSASIISLFHWFVDDLFGLASGDASKVRIKFDSVATIKYYSAQFGIISDQIKKLNQKV